MAHGIFVERARRDLAPRAPRQDAISADLSRLFSLNESQTFGLLPTADQLGSERSPLGYGTPFAHWLGSYSSHVGCCPAARYAFLPAIFREPHAPAFANDSRRLIGLNCCFLDARSTRHHLPKVRVDGRPRTRTAPGITSVLYYSGVGRRLPPCSRDGVPLTLGCRSQRRRQCGEEARNLRAGAPLPTSERSTRVEVAPRVAPTKRSEPGASSLPAP